MPAAFTRMTAQLPDDDGFRTFLETYFPPEKVAPFVVFLAHESTTINGETFSVGADRAARVFLAECPRRRGRRHARGLRRPGRRRCSRIEGWEIPSDMMDEVRYSSDHLGPEIQAAYARVAAPHASMSDGSTPSSGTTAGLHRVAVRRRARVRARRRTSTPTQHGRRSCSAAYDADTDHAWHQLERGEISFVDALTRIKADAEADGFRFDTGEMFSMMVTDEIDRTLVVEAVRMVRAKGLRTAIVTNNIREYGDAWRAQFPLDELFDAIVDSCEEGVRKPDPTIFHTALERRRRRRPDAARSSSTTSPATSTPPARSGMHGILVGDDPAPALDELAARCLTSPPTCVREANIRLCDAAWGGGVRTRCGGGGGWGGRRDRGAWRGRAPAPAAGAPHPLDRVLAQVPGRASAAPSSRCQASSASAPLRSASNHDSGSTRSSTSSGARPRCSAARRIRVSRASTRRAVAEARRDRSAHVRRAGCRSPRTRSRSRASTTGG